MALESQPGVFKEPVTPDKFIYSNVGYESPTNPGEIVTVGLIQYILNPAEQRSLAEAEGVVLTMVKPEPQVWFKDIEEFQNGFSSFRIFWFNSPDNPHDISSLYQQTKVFKRFLLIRPKLAAKLMGIDIFTITGQLKSSLSADDIIYLKKIVDEANTNGSAHDESIENLRCIINEAEHGIDKNTPTLEDYFEAYKIMSGLVDSVDDNVQQAPEGHMPMPWRHLLR